MYLFEIFDKFSLLACPTTIHGDIWGEPQELNTAFIARQDKMTAACQAQLLPQKGYGNDFDVH